ncbi:acetylxylan esterase 2 [Fusarium beomiforme]|uniref:Acetylxylan esterase 2 n=1 Tax=Fusarium beomiforme TaxID=44412 RepID=A0A9P5AR89_9HYPO|nr:acetylxylan esterase 2 [Fusarium beomiforme]
MRFDSLRALVLLFSTFTRVQLWVCHCYAAAVTATIEISEYRALALSLALAVAKVRLYIFLSALVPTYVFLPHFPSVIPTLPLELHIDTSHIHAIDTTTMLAFMLVVSLFLALISANSTANAITCAKNAHVIVARGSLEPQGPGAMGALAEQILRLIPGSDMEALVYPALYDEYVESQTQGVRTMTSVINNYAKNCPDTDLILMGYSQGAHVTMDTMCVAAIIAMGDPSLTEGQPFHVGTSEGSGIFPRNLPVGCDSIASKTVSICDKGDPYCEAGGKELSVHLSYIKNYGEYAINHVVKAFKSRH